MYVTSIWFQLILLFLNLSPLACPTVDRTSFRSERGTGAERSWSCWRGSARRERSGNRGWETLPHNRRRCEGWVFVGPCECEKHSEHLGLRVWHWRTFQIDHVTEWHFISAKILLLILPLYRRNSHAVSGLFSHLKNSSISWCCACRVQTSGHDAVGSGCCSGFLLSSFCGQKQ